MYNYYLIGWGSHAARVEVDVKSGTQLSRAGSNVNAVGVAVVALGEDHAVEGPIEFYVDPHVSLLALHLQVLDLWLIARLADGPWIFWSRAKGTGSRVRTRWWEQRRWEQRTRSTRANGVIGRQRDLSFVVVGCQLYKRNRVTTASVLDW